ncbi:MAG: hypothetical protein M1833_002864 [Piccolia ochrophora]|nr:MAG: hypothetical protein M1833_002864 [Piccolia ochrophora]
MDVTRSSVIDHAFSDQPEIRRGIVQAAAQTPQYETLFVSISEYVTSLKRAPHPPSDGQEASPSKKRRLDNGPAQSINGATIVVKQENGVGAAVKSDTQAILTLNDVSFSVPQRKKLTLVFTDDGLRANVPATGEALFGVAWKDIDHAVVVPVPEKAQKQFSFCIFPRSPPSAAASTDAIVFTVPEADPTSFNSTLSAPFESDDAPHTFKTLLLAHFHTLLPPHVRVIEPDTAEFVSPQPEAHRKGEPAFHIKAFRGSKDGYIFPLPTGLLWAFKKPLYFFSFAAISSVSYTSVLQRTFNLNVAVSTNHSSTSALNVKNINETNPPDPNDEDTSEFEFAMLDQPAFPALDAYLKRHALHDASMAAARRAKLLNINPPAAARKDGGGNDPGAGVGVDDDPSGISPAIVGQGDGADGEERDIEDEEEEDYDPGSEGESEGSGSGSDSDEMDDEGEGGGGAGEEEEGEEVGEEEEEFLDGE